MPGPAYEERRSQRESHPEADESRAKKPPLDPEARYYLLVEASNYLLEGASDYLLEGASHYLLEEALYYCSQGL